MMCHKQLFSRLDPNGFLGLLGGNFLLKGNSCLHRHFTTLLEIRKQVFVKLVFVLYKED
jgi:hypothetical protein